MAKVTPTQTQPKFSGSLVGNFKGSREQTSIFLFLYSHYGGIFNQLLKEKVLNPQFSFHPKCEFINLSSLTFADDLFILSKTDPTSVKVMKEALEKFRVLSRLQPILQEYEIFTSEINSQEKDKITEISSINLGSLPMKYLRAPFITGKLSDAE